MSIAVLRSLCHSQLQWQCFSAAVFAYLTPSAHRIQHAAYSTPHTACRTSTGSFGQHATLQHTACAARLPFRGVRRCTNAVPGAGGGWPACRAGPACRGSGSPAGSVPGWQSPLLGLYDCDRGGVWRGQWADIETWELPLPPPSRTAGHHEFLQRSRYLPRHAAQS